MLGLIRAMPIERGHELLGLHPVGGDPELFGRLGGGAHIGQPVARSQGVAEGVEDLGEGLDLHQVDMGFEIGFGGGGGIVPIVEGAHPHHFGTVSGAGQHHVLGAFEGGHPATEMEGGMERDGVVVAVVILRPAGVKEHGVEVEPGTASGFEGLGELLVEGGEVVGV